MLVPSPRGDGEKGGWCCRKIASCTLVKAHACPFSPWRRGEGAAAAADEGRFRASSSATADEVARARSCSIDCSPPPTAPHPVLPHHLLPAARGEETRMRCSRLLRSRAKMAEQRSKFGLGGAAGGQQGHARRSSGHAADAGFHARCSRCVDGHVKPGDSIRAWPPARVIRDHPCPPACTAAASRARAHARRSRACAADASMAAIRWRRSSHGRPRPARRVGRQGHESSRSRSRAPGHPCRD